ncbi:dethiobiotin synthase [Alishewanella tabrizica]|uniref:ATP-dependent dethiobiotin synthetase BioD n=1 Tax=Alishewanella tabrizica TaxID=671278 RepID=A0ABQ2WJG7_9ALTE|nr:dethiobiotin synthase [Alishewanella tabrizica]GGW58035.1 ATP-dependent dethiobiotin synthetase BioD 1 [Alishewanella tabrizica]
MTHAFFVTGTDTDAGKTYVSTLILQGAAELGITAIGAKPIAAGAELSAAGTLENSDALLLQQHSGIALPYVALNPICLAKPAAPHLVAAELGLSLDEQILSSQLAALRQYQAQLLLLEGAGGWLLPLSAERYLADWVADQQLPVLLVVGVKLGCLNHAMLSVQEIARRGCRLVGWIANITAPEMLFLSENLADLQRRISAPLLGTVPYQPDEALRHSLAVSLATAVQQALIDSSRS